MSNQVQLLKSRFEKLNNSSGIADALDIASIRVKKEPQLKFARSATCIDFSRFRLSEVKKEPENLPKKVVSPVNHPTFQRQLSNSSNTSQKSIRRSPAFRFDANCRPSIVKSLTKDDQDKRKTEIDKELQYLASSVTIKKALMRPLPKGSPPKKPPRAFLSPPPDFSPLASESLQSRIQKLKAQPSRISPNTLPKKNSVKTDDKKAISSFLNCIISPCSIDPIYYEQIRREQKHKREEPEQIYMEPYEHLLYKDFQSNVKSSKEELHYMCTDLSGSSDFNGNSSSREDVDERRSSLESSDIEDYEKINLLFNVVYDEKHRDNIIDETSHSSGESAKSSAQRGISRSLTEKRKDYVRKMTQISMSVDAGSKEGLATLKKAPSAAVKISQFQNLIDANKTKLEKKEELFDMALLIGFDVTKMTSYIKSVFPKTAKPPAMIEQFIYPTAKTPSDLMTRENQNFCLVLTDEYGSHLFGYCRQVVPEGFEICLPLTYCIISGVKATGFYFNVLKEIEARHGQPEAQFSYLLRQLQCQELPKSGSFLHAKLMESPITRKFCPEIAKKPDREVIQKSQTRFNKRLSLETPEWLRNENSLDKPPFDLSLINRSLEGANRGDEVLIRRPNDLRLECSELSVLYECLTADLLVIIFGTLLIERKVILVGRNISKLSSCIVAMNSILYPFQWQHTIITITPDNLSELIQAPFPILAGFLKDSVNLSLLEIEDGIVVDIETKSLIRKCGDDTTLLPESLKKSLMLSLKIVDAIGRGKMLSNVLIAEAFLQFFIKIFANLSTKAFTKEKFIESHSDLAVKYFLEWFLGTIMFKEFLRKKVEHEKQREEGVTSPNYFDLYNTKVLEKSATISTHQQRKNVELLMKTSRHRNKKRNFKDRMKDFLGS